MLSLLPQNLQDKIMPEPMSGCWIWIGAKAGRNYGVVQYNGKMKYAHNVVREILIGKMPEGMEPDHLCRLPCCVNPHHIEPVTHKENLRRSSAIESMRKWAKSITHCPRGHVYDSDNTFVHKNKRSCRKCRAIAVAKFDERNRESRKLAAREYRRKIILEPKAEE